MFESSLYFCFFMTSLQHKDNACRNGNKGGGGEKNVQLINSEHFLLYKETYSQTQI